MPFDGFTHWTSDLEPQHSRPKSRLEKNPEEKWGVLDLSLIKPRARRENARVYDKSATAQTVGRYVESDPSGFRGGLNLFSYAAQNPTEFIDPSGLYHVSVTGGFDLPFSPGIAVGPTGGVDLYDSNNPYEYSLAPIPVTGQMELLT